MEKQDRKKNYAVVTRLVRLKVGLGSQPCIPGAPGDSWSLPHLGCCLAPGLGSRGLQGVCVWDRVLLKHHACPSRMAGTRQQLTVLLILNFSDILPLSNCHSDIQKMALVAKGLA